MRGRLAAPRGAPAAVLAELASSGASVLGLVADRPRGRAPMERTGARLADYGALEREPEPGGRASSTSSSSTRPSQLTSSGSRACPSSPWRARAGAGPGYLHLAWGEPERRFALAALGRPARPRRRPRRRLPRPARRVGEAEAASAAPRGAARRAALTRADRRPRRAASRVLAELGLVQGAPQRGGGAVGVVSSERTDLERSAAYRAYGARYQEGRRYLEGLKQT